MQDGLSNTKGVLSNLTTSIKREADTENSFKIIINNLFSTKVLGYNTNKYQYNLLLEFDLIKTGRRLEVINFDGTKVWNVLDNIDKIINIYFFQDNKKNYLKKALENYQNSFAILRKNSDLYTAEELYNYKISMNYFATIMVKYYCRKNYYLFSIYYKPCI